MQGERRRAQASAHRAGMIAASTAPEPPWRRGLRPRGANTPGMSASVPDRGFWSGRRVLVTGHTGFKGAWLCLWLAELGARVSGFAHAAPEGPSLFALAGVEQDVESVTGDVRDTEAVAAVVARLEPEIVIHMAAQAFVRRSFAEPVATYATNVMGTVNVLDAVRRGDRVRVVVVVSSDKCYENREWVWGYRESDPMGGHDPYSSSKGATELVTAAYRASFFDAADAPAVASARAGNVYGGGDWSEDRLLPDVFRAALAGDAIRVRNPEAVRPWQHVLNPLSGYLRLAERAWDDRQCARGFNFGPADDDARPVRWIVECVEALWDAPLRWEVDPGPHPHEAQWLKLDSSLARARLGWTPHWDLEDGLERTVAWHQAHRDGADVRETTLTQLREFGS
jgi:CDP-glucose 4,6-dehydratase